MKTGKIILGGLAGGVVFFLLGWLVYGVLLMDYFSANLNQCASRPEGDMIWWSLIVAYLAIGFLLAFIFSWANIKSMVVGLIAGGVIGLLISISMDLSMYSMSLMYSGHTAVCVDIIIYTLMMAVSGGVVALIMGLGKKEA